MFYNFFSRKSYILWDNIEIYGRGKEATDDNITRRMRFTCRIIKATHALRICNNDCFLTATMDRETFPIVTFILTLPLFYQCNWRN
jgi:hypothetical protein